MKVSVLKPCRTKSRRLGLCNEFATMEWQACLRTPKIIFLSSSIPRVLPFPLGAAGETFAGKHFITFMDS